MNAISLNRSSYSALIDFQGHAKSSSLYPPKLYFKNLNGLRFFAALLVILSHLEALKHIFQLKNYEAVHFFTNAGCIGVVLFFVLSGFLITSLLLKESKENNTIHINKFYMRRALRIWPLYFLILFLGSFIFPSISILSYTAKAPISTKQFLLYVLLMPNISGLFFAPLPFLAQLWSIGVEEQFYIIWPWVLSKAKNLLRFICSAVVLIWSLKFLLILLSTYHPQGWVNIVVGFIHTTPFDSLMIGALGSLISAHKNFQAVKNLVFAPLFQLCFYIGMVGLILFGIYFPFINTQVYSILFIILIMNLSLNERCIISLENKVINYLGKISYGLYIYHIVGIIMAIKIAKIYSLNSYFGLLFLSLSITLILSILSYELFEKWFLKMKEHYSTQIKTGEPIAGIYLVPVR